MQASRIYTALFISFLFLLSVSTVYSFNESEVKGTFLNPLRGTSDVIAADDAAAVFTEVEVDFAGNTKLITYRLLESVNPTDELLSLDGVYRYISLTVDNKSAVDKLTFTMKVNRSNSARISPTNVGLYALSNKNEWSQIGHAIAYTTNSQYVFTAQTQLEKLYAIGPEITIPDSSDVSAVVTADVVEYTTDTENTPEDGETDTETQTALTGTQNREYIDDADAPNYLLIVIIIVVISVVIGGVILYIIGRQKMSPTKVKSIENEGLRLKITEMIKKEKSDGEIVDELLDQNYSLDSILAELQTAGRMQQSQKR